MNTFLSKRQNEGAALISMILFIFCIIKVIDSYLDILSKLEPLPLGALFDDDDEQEGQVMNPVYTHRCYG